MKPDIFWVDDAVTKCEWCGAALVGCYIFNLGLPHSPELCLECVKDLGTAVDEALSDAPPKTDIY